MSNQSQVNEQELVKYRQLLQDAANMTPYIPADLRTKLEAGLEDDMRDAVLQLQIVAMQYGRALERRDQQQAMVMVDGRLNKTSELVKKLVSRSGQVLSQKPKEVELPQSKPLDLLIVPGQHLPQKI